MNAQPDRQRFKRIGDWYDFLNQPREEPLTGGELRQLRVACYKEIEGLRERPLLVYAAQFPSAHPKAPVSVDLGDVDGFTDLLDGVNDDQRRADILIHSPGGDPNATERLVSLLRSRFDDVSFLVPHSAYSAATMLALSGNEVLLHPGATLGPIDPQINGTPARSIKRGFEKVRERLKNEGPEALPAYVPLIEKYSLELLEICDDAEKLSQELLTEWLGKYMFGDRTDAEDVITEAVELFSDYDKHKTHARPLTYDRIRHLGLKVDVCGPPLSGLLREAHILLTGFFGGSPFVKLFEDSGDISWGRQFHEQVINVPMPVPQGEAH